MAQRFNCLTSTAGLESCSYSNFVDTQCLFRPRVAGVRCIESKSIDHHCTSYILATILWI